MGTIQRSSSTPNPITAFNDLELVAGFKSSGAYTLPRKSGELVAIYQGINPVSVLSDGNIDYKVVKIYDAAKGRDNASPKLRANADDFIKTVMHQTNFVSSGLNNQAQHVVPFQVALDREFDLGGNSRDTLPTLFRANTEHPYNAQFLPERAEFLTQYQSLGPASISNGSATLPAGTDTSGLTGAYHEGFHSAYNKGTAFAIQDILNELAKTNTHAVVTSAMVEAAIFAVQRGGREYASKLLPLYREFNRGGIKTFDFEHYTTEQINDLKAIKTNDDLAAFINKNVKSYGSG